MRRTAPPSGRARCGTGADWSAISLLNPQFSAQVQPDAARQPRRGQDADPREAEGLRIAREQGTSRQAGRPPRQGLPRCDERRLDYIPQYSLVYEGVDVERLVTCSPLSLTLSPLSVSLSPEPHRH